MSVVYEAIVLSGDESAIGPAFDALKTTLSLRLLRLTTHGFAIARCRHDSSRAFAAEQVHRLAAELSVPFHTTVAVHYDDRCALKIAVLFEGGNLVQEFGEQNEIWVPIDDHGDPVLNGLRYPGNRKPPNQECDCIYQAIDAGLDAAGFSRWLSAATLRQAMCDD
jgi:hypothetical protein